MLLHGLGLFSLRLSLIVPAVLCVPALGIGICVHAVDGATGTVRPVLEICATDN
jgi:hypothetical protein